MKKFLMVAAVLLLSLVYAQRETVVIQPQGIVVKAQHAPAVGVILGYPFRISYYTGSPIILGDDFRVSLGTGGIATFVSADAIIDLAMLQEENNLQMYLATGPFVGMMRYSAGSVSATGFTIGVNAVVGVDYRLDSDFSLALEAGPALGFVSGISSGSNAVAQNGFSIGLTGGLALKYYF